MKNARTKRHSLTFRARDDLRDRLKAAAAQNGRSLSEEIEARLEWSFAAEETVRQTVRILLDQIRLTRAGPKPERR